MEPPPPPSLRVHALHIAAGGKKPSRRREPTTSRRCPNGGGQLAGKACSCRRSWRCAVRAGEGGCSHAPSRLAEVVGPGVDVGMAGSPVLVGTT